MRCALLQCRLAVGVDPLHLVGVRVSARIRVRVRVRVRVSAKVRAGRTAR